jgi:AcrR family transcriptional regulator
VAPHSPSVATLVDSEAHATGPADVIAAATRLYLASETIDMSALASQLRIGRATLYRWVGNREELLASVLAGASERTFRGAEREAGGAGGDHVVEVMDRFMRGVVGAPGLTALTQREPLVFMRLATSRGAIANNVSSLIRELLEREQKAGRLRLSLPASALAIAIVRICDSQLYQHLLGRDDTDVDKAMEAALDTIRQLLGGDMNGIPR